MTVATSLLPAKYTLTMWRGDTWRKTIQLLSGSPTSSPLDISGYSATMIIRESFGGPIVYTLSSTTGQIAITANIGTLALSIPASDTVSLPTGGVYDLSIANGSEIDSVLWGTVRVKGIA